MQALVKVTESGLVNKAAPRAAAAVRCHAGQATHTCISSSLDLECTHLRKVASVVVQPLVVQVDDVCGDAVEELAVV